MRDVMGSATFGWQLSRDLIERRERGEGERKRSWVRGEDVKRRDSKFEV
jgi:hypothetical protein